MGWRVRRLDSVPVLAAAAIVFGGLSFWGAGRYLDLRVSAEEQRLSQRYRNEKIVVASRDLRAGDLLTTATLAFREIPALFVSSGSVSVRDVESVLGRTVSVPLRAGDPLFSSILESSATPVLSASLAQGLRAVTFPVDEVNSFSGLLVPGDVIDLLLASDPGAGGSDWAVRPIVQRVRIIATGRIMRHETRRDPGGRESTVDREFSTVTAHVSPADAARIALAVRLGGLTAILRNPADTADLDSRAVRASELLSGRRSQGYGRAARFAGEFVDLIVGGRGVVRVSRVRVAPAVMSAGVGERGGVG
jgi:pilus assembly protein CpaB